MTKIIKIAWQGGHSVRLPHFSISNVKNITIVKATSMSNTNNPNRRNRTQFAITHAIIVCWALAFLAPFVLFLIPMCTPEAFLNFTFGFALAVILVLLIPVVINCRGRLHDVGHTGSYLVRVFLPFSKVFKLLWSEGDPEENQFGPPPQYKIPKISYFAKILLAQGITFSVVATICIFGPPYLVLTSSQPIQLKHNVTTEEVESVYQKVQQAKQQKSTCVLTTKEINALINKSKSLAQKLHVHSIHAGALNTDKIQVEIHVNCKLNFLSNRYLTAKLELQVTKKPNQKMKFILKNMVGKNDKESPSWLNQQDISEYIYQHSPQLKILQETLDQIDLNYDWDNKKMEITFQ